MAWVSRLGGGRGADPALQQQQPPVQRAEAAQGEDGAAAAQGEDGGGGFLGRFNVPQRLAASLPRRFFEESADSALAKQKKEDVGNESVRSKVEEGQDEEGKEPSEARGWGAGLRGLRDYSVVDSLSGALGEARGAAENLKATCHAKMRERSEQALLQPFAEQLRALFFSQEENCSFRQTCPMDLSGLDLGGRKITVKKESGHVVVTACYVQQILLSQGLHVTIPTSSQCDRFVKFHLDACRKELAKIDNLPEGSASQTILKNVLAGMFARYFLFKGEHGLDTPQSRYYMQRDLEEAVISHKLSLLQEPIQQATLTAMMLAPYCSQLQPLSQAHHSYLDFLVRQKRLEELAIAIEVLKDTNCNPDAVLEFEKQCHAIDASIKNGEAEDDGGAE